VYTKGPILSGNLAKSIIGSTLYWMCLGAAGTWVKEMKYQLNWSFVDSERRCCEDRLEYPERDVAIFGPDGVFSVGFIQKRFNMFLRTKTWKEKSRSLRLTVLQGIKRGMPTVDRNFILQAAEKHKKILSQVHETPNELLEFIREEVIRMIPPYKEDFGSIGSKISHKSCSEQPMANLGALCHTLSTIDSCQYTGAPPCGANIEKDMFGKESTFWRLILHHTLSADQLYRIHYSPHLGCVEERFRFDFSFVKKQCHYLSFEDDFYQEDTSVKFILEPLKCRTITKAPAFVNGIYKDLQKHLWKRLRSMWQFALIGETVTSSHVQNLWAETAYCHAEDQEDLMYWVSGDYSAATDNMHMDVTQTILDAIMRHDPVYQKVMERALVGNWISYDKCHPSLGAEDIPADFQQTNGQLMGCIFSFPLLCLTNYLVYKYTIRQVYGKKHLLYKRCPVLINGDDILFRATPEFIDQWTKNIKLVGFEKSVGKNFEAKKFCTINSVYFLPEQDRAVPYLNHGFIYDMKKGMDTDGDLTQQEGSVNSKLYQIGFSDYFKYWDTSSMARFRHAALAALLEHRRDIGWSGRSLFDLGLEQVDTDSIGFRYFRDKVASSKAACLHGLSREVQASNVIYSLMGENIPPNIKTLKRQCLRKTSIVYWAAKKLIGEQKKYGEERLLENRSPAGLGQFFGATVRLRTPNCIQNVEEKCKTFRSIFSEPDWTSLCGDVWYGLQFNFRVLVDGWN